MIPKQIATTSQGPKKSFEPFWTVIIPMCLLLGFAAGISGFDFFIYINKYLGNSPNHLHCLLYATMLSIGLMLVTAVAAIGFSGVAHSKSKTVPIYGGFMRRLGAMVIDGAMMGLLPITIFWFGAPAFLNSVWLDACRIALILALELYMLKRWGQTPGKWVMGLKVFRTDLKEIGWREAFLRNVFDVIYIITPLLAIPIRDSFMYCSNLGGTACWTFPVFLLGVGNIFKFFLAGLWSLSEPIVLLSNPKKRALHDFIAGTVVVVLKKDEDLSKMSRTISAICLSLTVLFLITFLSYRGEYHKRNAQYGNPVSQAAYLKFAFSSRGSAEDRILAPAWCIKSAEEGMPEAQAAMAAQYATFGPTTAAASLRYYQLAAMQGDSQAILHFVKEGVW